MSTVTLAQPPSLRAACFVGVSFCGSTAASPESGACEIARQAIARPTGKLQICSLKAGETADALPHP